VRRAFRTKDIETPTSSPRLKRTTAQLTERVAVTTGLGAPPPLSVGPGDGKALSHSSGATKYILFLRYGYEGEAVVPMSLGPIDLINCMSTSTPALTPEKMLTDGILMKRPGTYGGRRKPKFPSRRPDTILEKPDMRASGGAKRPQESSCVQAGVRKHGKGGQTPQTPAQPRRRARQVGGVAIRTMCRLRPRKATQVGRARV